MLKLIVEITEVKDLLGVEYLKTRNSSDDDLASFHDVKGNVTAITPLYMALINSVSNNLTEYLTSGGLALKTENEETLDERYGADRISRFFLNVFNAIELFGLRDVDLVSIDIIPGGYAIEVSLEPKEHR